MADFPDEAITKRLSPGLNGADFIGLPAIGATGGAVVKWTVCEAKGHQRAKGCQPYGPTAVSKAKASPLTGAAGLKGALAQVVDTAAQLRRGGAQTESFAGICWLGGGIQASRTVVQLVDPEAEWQITDQAMALFVGAFRQAIPTFHYRWIGDLLGVPIEWGKPGEQAREFRKLQLGDHLVEAAFVREEPIEMDHGPDMSVVFGLDRRAVDASDSGSLEALYSLPSPLPPGLGADGLIIDTVYRG